MDTGIESRCDVITARQEAAEELQMTPGAVRVAKCRVLHRLTEFIEPRNCPKTNFIF
jgi:hypothetical protein